MTLSLSSPFTTLALPGSTPLVVVVVMLLLASAAALLVYLFYPALTSAYETSSWSMSKSGSPSALSSPASLVRVSAHGKVQGLPTGSVTFSPPTTPASSPSPSSPAYPTPLLSVIVPAYNEEARLPLMLEPALAYLSDPSCEALRTLLQHQQCRGSDDDRAMKEDGEPPTSASPSVNAIVVEWIVVSDGSTDGTERVYSEFCSRLSNFKDQGTGGVVMLWKFLELTKNRGKGMAVKAGVLASTGQYCLMVDADGATQFDHLSRLAGALRLREPTEHATSSRSPSLSQTAATTVWGSRAHLQDVPEKRRQRSLPRQFLMKAFHAFVRIICTRPNSPHVRDTQCGFKLFPRRQALALFSNLHLRGWAFDIELLILSSFLQIGIEEVDVNWREVDGSKLSTSPWNVILVSVSMLRDMICVRLCYELGLWKIRGYDENDGSDDEVDDDGDYVRVSKGSALPEETLANNKVGQSHHSKSE